MQIDSCCNFTLENAPDLSYEQDYAIQNIQSQIRPFVPEPVQSPSEIAEQKQIESPNMAL